MITTVIPVTNSLKDLFDSCDVFAISAFLTKKGFFLFIKAIERALSSKFSDAREAVLFKLVDIMGAFKSNFLSSGQSTQLVLPESLKFFPLFTHGLMKSVYFN